MKLSVKIIVVVMLLFNGVGAIYGGTSLILDPTGRMIQLPASYLDHTPFRNYLIPGIILLSVNGLFSFITIATILLKLKKAFLFITTQGALLSGWIIVQILLIRTFYTPLHLPLLF